MVEDEQIRWYGAHTLYAYGVGDGLAPQLVERRVVLVQARDMQHALEVAEAEAHEYADSQWANLEGEEVRGCYLGCCDVFDMQATPGAAIEVYSTTQVVRDVLSDTELVDRFSGEEESEQERALRERFEIGDLLPDAD